jgi:hypothetical protein
MPDHPAIHGIGSGLAPDDDLRIHALGVLRMAG